VDNTAGKLRFIHNHIYNSIITSPPPAPPKNLPIWTAPTPSRLVPSIPFLCFCGRTGTCCGYDMVTHPQSYEEKKLPCYTGSARKTDQQGRGHAELSTTQRFSIMCLGCRAFEKQAKTTKQIWEAGSVLLFFLLK